MGIKIIACLDKCGGIGRNGTIPWRHSIDLKFFKNTTQNHIVVMGHKTFISLNRKPLPNRINIVVTSAVTQDIYINDTWFTPNLDILVNGKLDNQEVFIIGGTSIYKQTLDSLIPTELILSYLNIDGECDTLFPAIPAQYRADKIEVVSVGDIISPGYRRVTYVRTF